MKKKSVKLAYHLICMIGMLKPINSNVILCSVPYTVACSIISLVSSFLVLIVDEYYTINVSSFSSLLILSSYIDICYVHIIMSMNICNFFIIMMFYMYMHSLAQKIIFQRLYSSSVGENLVCLYFWCQYKTNSSITNEHSFFNKHLTCLQYNIFNLVDLGVK